MNLAELHLPTVLLFTLIFCVAFYLWVSFTRSLGNNERGILVVINLSVALVMLSWPGTLIPPMVIFFALFVTNFLAKVALFKKQQLLLDLLEDQLSNALLIISGALKAGRSLEQGFSLVERGMPAPISDEFRKILQEQHLGISFEESLRNFMKRTPSKDYKLFLTATLFQRETGGNLIALYDQIIFAVTERRRLKGRIDNLTQQGRLTGYIMMCLPIMFLSFLVVAKPTRLLKLTELPYGQLALFGPFILLTVGIVWLWTIVNKEIG